jgi:hypothetical protein
MNGDDSAGGGFDGVPEHGIELDLDGPDDPLQALQQALAARDAERALGAFRLLEAAGRRQELGPEAALQLADLLEHHDRPLDAARACRLAAESDLAGPAAPAAILRGARLLLGPADNPAAGRAMARFLVDRYPDHRLVDEARALLAGGSAAAADSAAAAEPAVAAGPQPATATEPVPAAGPDGPAEPIETAAPAAGRAEPAAYDFAAYDYAASRSAQQPPPGGPLAQAVQRVTGRLGSVRYRRLARLYRGLLLAAGLAYAVGWWQRDRADGVETIHPAVLAAPQQTALADTAPIDFTRDGYHYRLTPKFGYRIAGLIVSLRDYTFMSVRQSDEVFPMDLCLIWGDNARRGLHRDPSVEFSQHGRFCVYRSAGARVRDQALSNNHVLLADPALEETLWRLTPGDQIRLTGKLVDVEAVLIGSGGTFDPRTFRLASSTTRNDTGGGACEVIYVERIEMLRAASRWARILSEVAFWTLAVLLLLAVARFVLLPVRLREID